MPDSPPDMQPYTPPDMPRDTRADAHVFTRRFDEGGGEGGPLAGLRVSVKALFDVRGYPTTAGSPALSDAPARDDAISVARLRAAGARLVGHTSMTELAYSGLGVNPAGTPDNPLRPGTIPGGSTAGGAVSIALGLADAALGTDTGGSLRIPAAFCGLVGFKPTQASVPREGCVPLSPSLDSVGPIARDVATCARVWRVLADGEPAPTPDALPDLVVPANFGRTDTDREVEDAFAAALDAVRGEGATVAREALPSLDAYAAHPVWHYAAIESRAAHAGAWERRRHLIDPRVASRMARADGVGAVRYRQTLDERVALIAAFRAELGGRMLALPTVAVPPPTLEAVEADYDRLNLLALRNTTLANVMDGCSISLPIGRGRPVGFMLTAPGGADEALLAAAARLEPVLAAL